MNPAGEEKAAEHVWQYHVVNPKVIAPARGDVVWLGAIQGIGCIDEMVLPSSDSAIVH